MSMLLQAPGELARVIHPHPHPHPHPQASRQTCHQEARQESGPEAEANHSHNPTRAPRTIFASDLHLGCRYSRAEAFLAFLEDRQPEYLYLVGDIFDGWRLSRGWYWNKTYDRILQKIMHWTRTGTDVFYTPGNHDEFLRNFLHCFGNIHVADEFIHQTADGRRLLVTHGDQFDSVVRRSRWLSILGDIGYNQLLRANGVLNWARRRAGLDYWSLSGWVKHKVKEACQAISNFQGSVLQYAADRDCDGIICGHIHTPVIIEANGVVYYNTGDWVENCTALVEMSDGNLELLRQPAWECRRR